MARRFGHLLIAQELTYYLELLRALPARKHPTAKQRAWGRPLIAELAVCSKTAPSDVWETLRALYRGKAQLLESKRALRPTQPPRCVNNA